MSTATPANPIRFSIVEDPTIANVIIVGNSSLILADKESLCGSSMQQEPPPPPSNNEGEFPETAAGEEPSHKSERKRQRERQRRSALAGAFDELTSLLSQLEPDYAASLPSDPLMDSSSASGKRKRRRATGQEDLEDSSGMTRLDLIGRTVGVLRRLQKENADLKRRLVESASGSGDSDQKVSVQIQILSFRKYVTFLLNDPPLHYNLEQNAPGSLGNGADFVSNGTQLLDWA